MKNKENKKYCFWKNLCTGETEHLCCTFCSKQTCKYRCHDNCARCGYLAIKEEILALNKEVKVNNIDITTWEPKKKKEK